MLSLLLAPAFVRPARAGLADIPVEGLDGFFDLGTGLAIAPAAVPVEPLPDTKGSHPELRLPDSLLEAARDYGVQAQLAKLQARPADTTGTVPFAVLGDMEPGRFFWERGLWGQKGVGERQLRAIQSEDVDFTVQLGDFVSRGTKRNYVRFFKTMRRVDPATPYFPVLGNHDRRSPHRASDAAYFEAVFGPSNYALERGGCRFVFVDTTGGGVTAAQLAWLDTALDTDKTKIVFIHIPPMQVKRFLTLGLGGFGPGSEAFTDLMARRGVARVYCGHIHGLAWATIKGVRYVLSGGGGSPLYPSPVERVYHYLTVEAGPTGVRELVHTLDGQVFPLPTTDHGIATAGPDAG